MAIEPTMATAEIATQLLGFPSTDALRKKFTRSKNPWPSRLRMKDERTWFYDIPAIKNWLFRNDNIAQ